MQSKLNEKELELQRSKDVVNQANKQLKIKEGQIKSTEEKLKHAYDLLKEASLAPNSHSEVSLNLIKNENVQLSDAQVI